MNKATNRKVVYTSGLPEGLGAAGGFWVTLRPTELDWLYKLCFYIAYVYIYICCLSYPHEVHLNPQVTNLEKSLQMESSSIVLVAPRWGNVGLLLAERTL